MQQKLKKKGKGIIKTCDLFGHGARLVYQGQSQYETITGGLISIMLILIFIVLFWSTMESTLNKENVKVSETNHYDQKPKQTQFQLKNSMMFAVGLNNIDLINGPRYFDIFMQQRNQSSTGRIKTEIQLSACKRQDWDTFGYGQTFDRVKMNTWLCPRQGLDTKLQLQGKYTSETFKYAKISVRKCDPLLDMSRPCASDSVIDNYLQQHQSFTFNFYYINTMINSCNQTANQTFLDDTNYFLFNKQDGISADLFVSQYEIDTDQSLLPNQDHTRKSGVLVLNRAETQSYKVRGTEYVKFYIRKSALSRQIARSYRKIDDLISYMGGLFSFLLAAFGFISIYNEYSYHIEVTRRSFNYDEKQKFDHNSLNLFTFFGLLIYSFFQELDIDLGWKSIKKIYDFSSESCQHLDISLIFQKLQFVEKLAKVILTQSQYAGLLMSRPSSIQEAKSTRQDLTRYSKFRKHCCGDQEPNYYFDDVYEDQRNSADSSKKQKNKPVEVPLQMVAEFLQKQEQIADQNKRMRQIENQMYQKIGEPLKILQAQKQNQTSFACKIWNMIDKKVIKRYSYAEREKQTAQKQTAQKQTTHKQTALKPGKTITVRIQSNQQQTEEVKQSNDSVIYR